MSLVLEGVSKKFESAAQYTLRDISLTIEDGEFLCVIGPSGCGKTTLLNIIAGLEAPTEGSVTLGGEPIRSPGPDRAVMFQESALFPWLTVAENVKFGLRLAGYSPKRQEETAARYLEMVHLAHYRDYRPHQLSGGMKQRAALARALALNSKLLLMDEPFASVDKQTRNKLREEIENVWLQTRKTVFFITHSVEEAVFFADRVILLGAAGTLKGQFTVGLERPRRIEAPDFIGLRADLLERIRIEVNESDKEEYRND